MPPLSVGALFVTRLPLWRRQVHPQGGHPFGLLLPLKGRPGWPQSYSLNLYLYASATTPPPTCRGHHPGLRVPRAGLAPSRNDD